MYTSHVCVCPLILFYFLWCSVSRAEVRAVLRELKGEYVSKREAKRFLTSLDANKYAARHCGTPSTHPKPEAHGLALLLVPCTRLLSVTGSSLWMSLLLPLLANRCKSCLWSMTW